VVDEVNDWVRRCIDGRSRGQQSSPGTEKLKRERRRDGTAKRANPRRNTMLLIREVMHCKPGKVRAMVEKFVAMNRLGEKSGMPKMRIMTDFSAERYWTVVAEMEVESMEAFMAMMNDTSGDAAEMEEIMKGYHDLVDQGRREIYTIEG
jgi:hypothetical protein